MYRVGPPAVLALCETVPSFSLALGMSSLGHLVASVASFIK